MKTRLLPQSTFYTVLAWLLWLGPTVLWAQPVHRVTDAPQPKQLTLAVEPALIEGAPFKADALFLSNAGRLWTSKNGALLELQPQQMQHYPTDVATDYYDTRLFQGQTYFSTLRRGILKLEQGAIIPTDILAGLAQNSWRQSATEESLWLATFGSGIVQWSGPDQARRLWALSAQLPVNSGTATDLLQHQGRLYAATFGQGVVSLDLSQAQDYAGLLPYSGQSASEILDLGQAIPGPVTEVGGSFQPLKILPRPDGSPCGSHVYQLARLDDVHLLAASRNGLVMIDSHSQTGHCLPESFFALPGQAKEAFRAVLVDKDGHIWTGSRNRLLVKAQGSAQFVPVQLQLAQANLDVMVAPFRMMQTAEGLLWFSDQNGQKLWLKPDWPHQQAQQVNAELKTDSSNQYLFESSGERWWANGLGEMQQQLLNADGSMMEQRHFSIGQGLEDEIIFDSVQDERGNLWFANQAVLLHWDRQTQQMQTLDFGYGHQGIEGGLVHLAINEDRVVGHIYGFGLFICDLDQDCQTLDLRQQAPSASYLHLNGLTVVGHTVFLASQMGLLSYNLDSGELLKVMAKDVQGAPFQSSIEGLYKLGERGLWALSRGHLYPLLLQKHADPGEALSGQDENQSQIQSVIEHSGRDSGLSPDLQSSLTEESTWQLQAGPAHKLGLFNVAKIFSLILDQEGVIWVLSADRLYRLRPGELAFSRVPGLHGPFLSNLQLTEAGALRYVAEAGLVTLDLDYYRTLEAAVPEIRILQARLQNRDLMVAALPDKLILAHDERYLNLEFGVEDFANAHLHHYRYRLNQHEHWVDLGNQGRIVLSGLSAGHYHLQIQAENADGGKNDRAFEWSIEVLPPWWRSPLAYLAYILAALMLLSVAVFWRLREQRMMQLHQQHELALAQQQAVHALSSSSDETGVVQALMDYLVPGAHADQIWFYGFDTPLSEQPQWWHSEWQGHLDEMMSGSQGLMCFWPVKAGFRIWIWPVVQSDRALGVLVMRVAEHQPWLKLDCLALQTRLEHFGLAVNHARALSLAHDMRLRAQISSEAKSEFIAKVSHEIRTPMNGVLGMADLLSQSQLSDEQKVNVKTIADSGNQLLKLINDILDFSKVEAGHLELQLDDFEPRVWVESVLSMLAYERVQHGTELSYFIDETVPQTLIADDKRLRQVLMNLMGNACKFARGQSIEIRLSGDNLGAEQFNLRCQVIDSGCGIETDQLDDLFKPFTQADRQVQHQFGGTGLGLSICKQIVEEMSGQIQVKSRMGIGSEFSFDLPLKVAATPDQLHQVRDLAGEQVILFSQRSQRAVIVNLKAMLEQLGAQLHCLSSTADVRISADLWLMDSEMDASEFARYVQWYQGLEQPKALYILGSVHEQRRINQKIPELPEFPWIYEPVMYQDLNNKLLLQSVFEQIGGLSGAEIEMPLPELKVLVATNELSTQALITSFLDAGNHVVDVVDDLAQALFLSGDESYHLVFVDDRLRRQQQAGQPDGFLAGSQVPRVLVVSSMQAEVHQQCLEQGYAAILKRPFVKNELERILRSLNLNETG